MYVTASFKMRTERKTNSFHSFSCKIKHYRFRYIIRIIWVCKFRNKLIELYRMTRVKRKVFFMSFNGWHAQFLGFSTKKDIFYLRGNILEHLRYTTVIFKKLNCIWKWYFKSSFKILSLMVTSQCIHFQKIWTKTM